jgi:hypothetical protein
LNHAAQGQQYFEYAGHFYERPLYNADWAQAQADAASRTYRGLRGHLVTFMGDIEGPAVASFFGISTFWIAASDSNSEGTWIWTAGPETGQTALMLWNAEEPNGGTGENCAELALPSSRFSDKACTIKQAFVIEYECDLAASIDGCFGIHAPVPLEIRYRLTVMLVFLQRMSSTEIGTCGPEQACSRKASVAATN